MNSGADIKPNARKTRTGKVVGAAMQNTLVVEVERRLRHKLYGKEVKRVKRYHVHDPEEKARVGDTVRIIETRPISKTKRWRLAEIVRH